MRPVCPECKRTNPEDSTACVLCGAPIASAKQVSPAEALTVAQADTEELLRELEDEYGGQRPDAADVDELLLNLQLENVFTWRRDAAQQLGNLSTSSPQIVLALVTARDSDPNAAVREAAAAALRAPVHQEFGQSRPDFEEATERTLQQPPGAVGQPLGPGTGSVLTDQEARDSALSAIFHDRRWTWAPLYALFLIAATALALAVSRTETVLAAGAVWLAGAVLGLVILDRKGYKAFGVAFDLLNFAGAVGFGLALVLLALYVLGGPLILLIALLMRPRGSAQRTPKRREKAGYAGRSRSSPLDGEQGTGCTACGAWNTTGIEYCEECGAALQSAQA